MPPRRINLPTESRAKRMRRAMGFLREMCGEHLIIGCGAPLMPAFGLVDYCRIGCDVGLDWDGSFIMKMAHRRAHLHKAIRLKIRSSAAV